MVHSVIGIISGLIVLFRAFSQTTRSMGMRQGALIGVVVVALIGVGVVFLSNWHIPAPSASITKTIPDSRFTQ